MDILIKQVKCLKLNWKGYYDLVCIHDMKMWGKSTQKPYLDITINDKTMCTLS